MPTVLVIEDQKETISLLEAIFATRGITMLSAGHAQIGLDLMRAQLPDVVLMDLLLPEIDGFKAIEMIKADDDLKHIPVIAFTAASISNVHERLSKVGADAFIAKPFKIPELLDLTASFLH